MKKELGRYGLWCECSSSLTDPSWVINNDGTVVLYPSIAAAQRDIKENFVSKKYEIKEYVNDC